MAFHHKYRNVFLVLLQMFCQHGCCEVVYIKPTVDTPCPFSPCYTFMQYVSNPSVSLNITLVLLSGSHSLGTQFSVVNKSSFSMLGISNTSLSLIRCNSLGSFKFNSIQVVKLSNVSFIGCGCNKAQSVHRFTLQDSTFMNSSKGCNGGAWSISNSSDASINNCTFSNNQVRGSFRKGGTLYITGTNAAINNSVFVNNQIYGSFVEGGAVYNTQSNSTISESMFTSNQARGSFSEGGALYNMQSKSDISRSSFAYNQAKGSFAKGGAVYNMHSNSSISGSSLAYNRAGGSFANGGAVYSSQTNSSINGTLFKYNEASGSFAEGGAVYIKTVASVTISSLNECALFSNKVIGSISQGGALYAESSNTVGNVTYSDTILICQCRFSETVGQAVYINNVRNTLIRESTFTNNSNVALYSVFSDSDNQMFVSLSNFTNNNGAIASNTIKHMIIYGSNFTNNRGNLRTIQINGDRRREIRDNVTIDRCYFSNNTKGALYCYNVVTLSVNQSTFDNNTAKSIEGVVYFSGRDTNFTISHSVFSNNSALSCGVLGVRGLDNGSPELHGVRIRFVSNMFRNNAATGENFSGGVGCFLNASVTVVDSKFSHNLANSNGGVFHVNSSIIIAERSEFVNNSAGNNGGVAHVINSLVSLKDSILNHNQASFVGGALSIIKGNITIDNCTFDNNRAGRNGAVLYFHPIPSLEYITTLEITNSRFSDNMAVISGGILYAEGISINAIINGNCLDLNNNTEKGLFAAILNTDLTITTSNNQARLELGDDILACSSTVTVQGNTNNELSEDRECQTNNSECNCTTYVFVGDKLTPGMTCSIAIDYTDVVDISARDIVVTIVAVSVSVGGVVAILTAILVVILALVICNYRRARRKSITDADLPLEGTNYHYEESSYSYVEKLVKSAGQTVPPPDQEEPHLYEELNTRLPEATRQSDAYPHQLQKEKMNMTTNIVYIAANSKNVEMVSNIAYETIQSSLHHTKY